MRLGGDEQPDWNDRQHLFAAVAKTMRHILVDRARWRKRVRHGGRMRRVDLSSWNWERIDEHAIEKGDDTLLLVNDALESLAAGDPETAKLVELHFFVGLTVGEAAESLGISERTAQRRLAFARAWLGRAIKEADV
ncbi:Sigma-70, region 4 family [Verrucomicrobiia bacterium DG1235]|nr:Sigma-70, region 4 family [Verrucomicrobiae bacterium DG1235]